MHLVPPDPRLRGRWSRSLLERADGSRDETTEVTWLQAGRLYVDLRLPHPWPPDSAACLRGLTQAQAVALAAAEGFAGGLEADGDYAHWQRAVDLQPPAPAPDQGHLDPVVDDDSPDAYVVETGRDGSYREHWHRAGGPVDPQAAVLLADPDSVACAVLVRVGDDVAWARGRRSPLPAGPVPLAELVAAAELTAAQDLLDAEVSLGRVGQGAHRSNLPWRVGSPLGLDLHGGLARTSDTAVDGEPVVRTWHVLALEGSAADLPRQELP